MKRGQGMKGSRPFWPPSLLVVPSSVALIFLCAGAFGENPPQRQAPPIRPPPKMQPLNRAQAQHKYVLPLVHNPNLTTDGHDIALDTKLKEQKEAGDIQKSQILAARAGGRLAMRGGTLAPPSPSSSAASRTAAPSSRVAIAFDPSLLCNASNHSPTIAAMNGKVLGEAYFTNDSSANLYTFTGCNLGSAQGQMHLFGTFHTVQVPLTIDLWTDTSIIAHLPPDLTKELDQTNVKLVLAPANGPQTEYINLKFTAARQKLLLASMAQGAYQPASPIPVATGSPDGPYSFGDGRGCSGKFETDTDKFVFDQLLPGFVLSDMQLFPVDNPAMAHDPWSNKFSEKNAQVTWATVKDGQTYNCDYDVNFWVSGPVGFTSPWKGDNP